MTLCAILQTQTGIDPAANARGLEEAVSQAGQGGAAMLFTPEMVGYLDRDRQRAAEALHNEAGDAALAAARNAAAKYGIWVHIGSLGLKDERADGRWVNRSFVIDASGAIRARYDKMHLFDVSLATGESWRESAVYAPGEEAVAVDTPLGLLGLSICYDMRFPDLYRALSDAGACVLAVPAAFTVPTGRAHWHTLLRARAIESAAYVIAPAQVGRHEDGRETYGHSLVVDPWGEVVLDMGGQAPGLAFADLDKARLDDIRARIPVLDHRRAIGKVQVLP
jgi:deaminated glutathione amidase